MKGLLIAFFASFIATSFIVLSRSLHGHLTNDHDLKSIQKFHTIAVPRIGGLAVFFGLIIVWLWDHFIQKDSMPGLNWILIAALPIFFSGLSEDVTKKISAKIRLYLSFLSAALVYFFIHVHFVRLDWLWFDQHLLSIPFVSFIATLLVISGTVHAMNLVDGFNGLMLGSSLFMFLAIGCVSFVVNDSLVTHLALISFGATAGLFILNFPHGKIFAGDSGAYLIGYLLGVLVLMLVGRNPTVSAWFPCLLLIYPIFETLFSVYRKVYLRKMGPMRPDGMHLHMLIYKKITRFQKKIHKPYYSNAATSLYLWLLSLMGVIPAIFFWHSTWLTIISCILFTVIYVQFYWSLVFSKNIFGSFRKSASKKEMA